MLTFSDMFCGAGGFRLAFDSVGFKCVCSCDKYRFARKVYRENFGEEPIKDIRDIEQLPECDVMTAGFPCQPFSTGGKRLGLEDSRNGDLFFVATNLAAKSNIKTIVLENVSNFIFIDKGRTFSLCLDHLRSLGYIPSYRVYDSCSLTPQHRKRLFIVASKLGSFDEYWFDLHKEKKQLKEILLNHEDCLEFEIKGKNLEQILSKLGSHNFGATIVDGDSTTRTLTCNYAKSGKEIVVRMSDNRYRKLTPRECARLMGFPDDFKLNVPLFSAYKLMGNSVVVPLVRMIAERVKQFIIDRS